MIQKFLKCHKCNGNLIPNFFFDKETKETIISGLTCDCCLKNEITSDMTVKEYNSIVYQYGK